MAKPAAKLFKAFTVDGRLNLEDRAGFDAFLASVGDVDMDVTLRVNTGKKVRTPEQNRYYWAAVITPFSKFTSHTPGEVHAAFKARFLASVEEGIDPSSSELSPKEFADYTEQCIHLCVEMGCQIDTRDAPAPGTVVSMPRSARRKMDEENAERTK